MIESRLRRFWRRLVGALRAWRDDDGGLLAASIAYYASLSLFPLLLVTVAVLGVVLERTPWGQDAQTEIIQQIGDRTSPKVADEVASILGDVQTRAVISGPLGLLTLISSALLIFLQLERALDQIFRNRSEPDRSILAMVWRVLFVRLKAFLSLLVLAALVLGMVVAQLVLEGLETTVGAWVGIPRSNWWFLDTLIAVGVNWLLFSLVYRLLPRQPVSWGSALRGGALAAVLWEVGRRIAAAVLLGERYGAYGVIGAMIFIMVWVYAACAVLLLGAQFARITGEDRDQRHERIG